MAVKEKIRSIYRKIKEGYKIYLDASLEYFPVRRLI